MIISAQWELVLGNSFAYTVLSAFGKYILFLHHLIQKTDRNVKGFFYGGFGAIITPFFGVAETYGTDTVQFNNALGYWVLMWTVFNTFFLIASFPTFVLPPLSTLPR